MEVSHMAHSSSGRGRIPLKDETAGANPPGVVLVVGHERYIERSGMCAANIRKGLRNETQAAFNCQSAPSKAGIFITGGARWMQLVDLGIRLRNERVKRPTGPRN